MKTGSRPAALTCPCGRTQGKHVVRYNDCCARLIEAGESAANAEQLMRSRYTAYVLERFDYLRDTWDPATCPPDLGSEPGPQWLGLDVRRHEVLDARHALVEFVARYKIGGRGHRLQELSRFTLGDDGRWRYVEGEVSDA
jgi:SEC-C motif domain protein